MSCWNLFAHVCFDFHRPSPFTCHFHLSSLAFLLFSFSPFSLFPFWWTILNFSSSQAEKCTPCEETRFQPERGSPQCLECTGTVQKDSTECVPCSYLWTGPGCHECMISLLFVRRHWSLQEVGFESWTMHFFSLLAAYWLHQWILWCSRLLGQSLLFWVSSCSDSFFGRSLTKRKTTTTLNYHQSSIEDLLGFKRSIYFTGARRSTLHN